MTMLFVIIGLAIVLGLSFANLYNGLIRTRNQVQNAWSQIDVQLKRRHDLIPNLVETAKGYMKHEKETFEAVTKARSQAIDAKSLEQIASSESNLSGALQRMMLVVENYPQLQANQNFLSLQEELTSTENRISFARQNYNDQVLFYNNKVHMFPTNFVANMFHFEEKSSFEIEIPEERQAPKVAF
jgi:LemA protein